MGNFDVTALESLSEQLDNLPARKTLTPYELVRNLGPAIVAARDRGQDFKAIGGLLANFGVQLQPTTIRNYLWRARRAARGAEPPAAAETAAIAISNIPPQLSAPRAAAPVARTEAPASPASQPAARGAAPESPLERARRGAASSPSSGRFELIQDKEV